MLRVGPLKNREKCAKTVLETISIAVLNRSWTLYQRWVTKSWPAMESASPIKSLPQSWSGMVSDLVHQKRKRRVWKLFWKLDCLAVLSSSQTVNKRQVTNSWPLMSQLHPLSLFLSVDQWCQDLVHQKTKRRAWYLFWKLDCFTALNGSWLCTRDGWLTADL